MQIIQYGDTEGGDFLGWRHLVRHHHRHRAGRMRGTDTVERVFQHQAVPRRHADQHRRPQKRVRAGFAARHIVDRHHHLKPMPQAGARQMALGRRPGVGSSQRDGQTEYGEMVQQRNRPGLQRDVVLQQIRDMAMIIRLKRIESEVRAEMRTHNISSLGTGNTDQPMPERLRQIQPGGGRRTLAGQDVAALGIVQRAVHIENHAAQRVR